MRTKITNQALRVKMWQTSLFWNLVNVDIFCHILKKKKNIAPNVSQNPKHYARSEHVSNLLSSNFSSVQQPCSGSIYLSKSLKEQRTAHCTLQPAWKKCTMHTALKNWTLHTAWKKCTTHSAQCTQVGKTAHSAATIIGNAQACSFLCLGHKNLLLPIGRSLSLQRHKN